MGTQEGFLNNVFRVLLVAGHAMGQAKDAPTVTLDQSAEGIAIARARPRDIGCIASFHSNL